MKIEISPVVSNRDRKEFLRLPYTIYRNDPHWVAPLLSDMKHKIDRTSHPFFRHADVGLFVARVGGEVVGRISAQVDHRYNEFHADPAPATTGFWGFFECVDDPDVAESLLDAAAGFLSEHGMTEMIGPASFTLNHEAGLLVDGFGAPPVIAMTYNPDYYEALIEKTGAERAQDLYAYRLDASVEPPPKIVAHGHNARHDFRFRTIDMHDFEREVDRFLTVYNDAWEKNWGFVPMTEAEVRAYADQIRPIIDPNLVIVAERNGEPAAVGFTIPDVNQALIRARGRIGPITAARLLSNRRRRSWKVCRVFALGVRREFQASGIGAALYTATLDAAKRGGYEWGEMSWILESNEPMNRAIRQMGGTRYKTYRMYRNEIR